MPTRGGGGLRLAGEREERENVGWIGRQSLFRKIVRISVSEARRHSPLEELGRGLHPERLEES